MTYVKSTLIYEGTSGEEKREHIYTNDGSETDLVVDSDGDVFVHETLVVDEEEKELLTLYVPQHRIVDLKAKRLGEK